MKTGDIITPTHAIFKEGELYVYTLPEEPGTCKELSKGCTWTKGPCPEGECKLKDHDMVGYRLACAYTRAHPIKVDEKDKEKIKRLMFDSIAYNQLVHLYSKWVPQDLTEYRIEGVKFEVKNQRRIIRDYETGWEWVDTEILTFARNRISTSSLPYRR